MNDMMKSDGGTITIFMFMILVYRHFRKKILLCVNDKMENMGKLKFVCVLRQKQK